uniref:Amidohydrolase-related domain-containing protein n=1 Tax=Compsopogon caeruleus TaxID=31354 RepID=A0A7S1TIE0_9RHOD
MEKVGVIGGTSLLRSEYFRDLVAKTVETEFGPVQVWTDAEEGPKEGGERGVSVVFLQRHHADATMGGEVYRPPHLINHRANISALVKEGVSRCYGVCSVGSLKIDIPPSSLVVPDDYCMLFAGPFSLYDDARGHNVPGLDSALREDLLGALKEAGFAKVVEAGTYVQTQGPRFETPAEVRFIAKMGDIVGMTCGAEITIAKDAGLPYAAFCMVDNYANGLAGTPLTEEEFRRNVAENQQTVEKALKTILGRNPSTGDYLDRGVPRSSVDLLIACRWVLPLDDGGSCLENVSVVVENSNIVAILDSQQALHLYTAREVVSRPHCVLIPGLINAHTHTGMTLMRGKCDDEPLMEWLHNTVWPIEGAFIGQEGFCYDGAMLSIAEMIRGGVTCFSDMYWHLGEASRAVKESGIRAVLGMVVTEFPTSWGENVEQYLSRGHEVADEYRQVDTLTFTYAPHAPYTVADPSWVKIGELARKSNRRIHSHVHETRAECEASLVLDKTNPCCHRSDHLGTPLDNLDRLEILDEHFIAVHMVQLTDEEIELCARRKIHVVHCPNSNMKLASGYCRVAELLDAGVNVALGTDSAGSNNSLDLIAEMKMAALLTKGQRLDPTRIPAMTALRMATINGAKALGLAERTGSIEVGKAADLVTIELGTRAGTSPVFNPAAAIVYSASHSDVCDVWVNGRSLLRQGQLLTVNETDLLERASMWGLRLDKFAADREASNLNKDAAP